MAEPNLDLSTTSELERPKVRIDGELYEMRAPGELNLGVMRRVAAIEAGLEQDEEGPLAEKLDLMQELLEICMPDLPQAVSDLLTFEQVGKVVETFFALAGTGKPASPTDTPTP